MRALALFAVLALAAACGGATPHPELQRELDALVAAHVAPGVTAYVSGPRVTWSGAAGLADVATKEPMKPDARLRLESVSKLWTAVVVVALAQEHKLSLDDTLGKWWPSFFTGDKAAITIRELLDHTSGLLDNNDLSQNAEHWLGQTHDPWLRVQLLALGRSLTKNPSYVYDDLIEIKWAADLPLLFPPGTNWHYSNIGYKIAGRIAEKASGESLAALYQRIIIDPLHLKSAVYAPSGPIPGEHPLGYAMDGKKAVEASNVGEGALGPEGGIVSDAKDEATFLRAVVRGELVPTTDLLHTSAASGSYALGVGIRPTRCGNAYTHNGGGPAWASTVAVSADGKRVAVLLLNGRNSAEDPTYAAALLRLLCRA
ncbi:MAG: serine hydrolase domain-containing protein [Actinomycetota bacterium]